MFNVRFINFFFGEWGRGFMFFRWMDNEIYGIIFLVDYCNMCLV